MAKGRLRAAVVCLSVRRWQSPVEMRAGRRDCGRRSLAMELLEPGSVDDDADLHPRATLSSRAVPSRLELSRDVKLHDYVSRLKTPNADDGDGTRLVAALHTVLLDMKQRSHDAFLAAS